MAEKPNSDPSWENHIQTQLKRPRSDFAREIEALFVGLGLKKQTRDLVLKIRFGDRVKLLA